MTRTFKIICLTLVLGLPLNAVFRQPLLGEYLDLIIFFIAALLIVVTSLKAEVEKSMKWKRDQKNIFKYRNVSIRWWDVFVLSIIVPEFFSLDQRWSQFLVLIGVVYACEIILRMVLHRKYGLYFISISDDEIIKKRGTEDHILFAQIKEVRQHKGKIVLVDIWFEKFIIRPRQFLESEKLRTLLIKSTQKEHSTIDSQLVVS